MLFFQDKFEDAIVSPSWVKTGVVTETGGQLSFNTGAALGDNRVNLSRAFKRRAGLTCEFEFVTPAALTGSLRFGFGSTPTATLANSGGDRAALTGVSGVELLRSGSVSTAMDCLLLAINTTYRVRVVLGTQVATGASADGFTILIQGGAYGAIGSGIWHIAWWEQDDATALLYLAISNGTTATNAYKFNYVRVFLSRPVLTSAADPFTGSGALQVDAYNRPWLHPLQGITRISGAAAPDASGNNQIALVNGDSADGFMRYVFDIIDATLNNEQWLYFRYSDANNWWRWGAIGGGAGLVTLKLQKNVAGVVTDVFSQAAQTIANGDKFKVALQGSRVSAYLTSGSDVRKAVDTSGSLSTNVRHGLGFKGTTTARGDNFTFQPASPTPVVGA